MKSCHLALPQRRYSYLENQIPPDMIEAQRVVILYISTMQIKDTSSLATVLRIIIRLTITWIPNPNSQAQRSVQDNNFHPHIIVVF
jgi:hypothetical protein